MSSKNDNRYYVQSEHVRGEQRVYWVNDRMTFVPCRGGGKEHAAVTRTTTAKNTAEKWAKKLNEKGDIK